VNPSWHLRNKASSWQKTAVYESQQYGDWEKVLSDRRSSISRGFWRLAIQGNAQLSRIRGDRALFRTNTALI
jgi:hypothetical protein